MSGDQKRRAGFVVSRILMRNQEVVEQASEVWAGVRESSVLVRGVGVGVRQRKKRVMAVGKKMREDGDVGRVTIRLWLRS